MQRKASVTERLLPTVPEVLPTSTNSNGVLSTTNALHLVDGECEIQDYGESAARDTNNRFADDNGTGERAPTADNPGSKTDEMSKAWRERQWIIIVWALFSSILMILIIVSDHLYTGKLRFTDCLY